MIKNQLLRTALADYYITGSAQQRFIFEHIPEYRETIRALTPSKVTRHIWKACHEETGYNAQALYDCDSPLSDDEAQTILDNYLADPDVLKELRFWMSTLETTQRLLVTAKNGADKVASQIGRELNNSATGD